MDVISDILAAVKLAGSLYFRTEFRGPFGIRVPVQGQTTRFHLVLTGSCWIKVPHAGGPQQLSAGDLMVIPHGAAQILSDRPDRRAMDLPDLLARTAFDGTGPLQLGLPGEQPETRLICGFCDVDAASRHPFLASLPRYLLLRSDDSLNSPWLADGIRFMTHEAHSGEPGHRAVLDRLAEILVIQSLRVALSSGDGSSGFLNALRHPGIGRAIAAIHRAPATGWSVTSLAREAGVSRSRFAGLFRDMVGQPPMDYVTDWRLLKARRLLTTTRLSVAEVAHQVGYASLPSFTHRFKQRFGIGPGAWRKNA